MNFMDRYFGYIPLQNMTEDQIDSLSLDQLRTHPLEEFLQLNGEVLKDETRRALLRSRSLPEQLQIQMAWQGNPLPAPTNTRQTNIPARNLPPAPSYNPTYDQPWYAMGAGQGPMNFGFPQPVHQGYGYSAPPMGVAPFIYGHNPQAYLYPPYAPPTLPQTMFLPQPIQQTAIPPYRPLGQMTTEAIQNLSRSDLENRPLNEFAGLATEQAIALDSFSLTAEQERTVLDNLRDANSRQRVEGEYTLQKAFQVRWNAGTKSIEYYIWDPKHHHGGWGRPDGEVYAEALEKHEKSHIRRERLNASSTATNPPAQADNNSLAPYPSFPSQSGPSTASAMYYGGQQSMYYGGQQPMYYGEQVPPYSIPPQPASYFGASSSSNTHQANTPATRNPQTTREIELAENIVKMAGHQRPPTQRKTEQAIETFRHLAAGEQYNLDARQIETLLSNYFTMDINIERSPSALGIPFEYLARMAQLNEGRWPEFITMPRAIEKVVSAYRQFFQNHKDLTDFGIAFERRAPLLEQLHQIRELKKLSQDLDTHHRLLGYHVDYLRMRKVDWVVNKDYDRPSDSEDQPSTTLKLLVESSPAIATRIETEASLFPTVESLATSEFRDEDIHIDTKPLVRKFIDSENLPELAIPDQMLWREDDLPMVILRWNNVPADEERLNNDIAAAPPLGDSVAPFLPKSVPQKIFQDLLEQADEDLKQYFSEDTENALFTIRPEIFKHVENNLKAQSKPFVLALIKHKVEDKPLTSAEEQAITDAKSKMQSLKGLNALSRICDRLPQTQGYEAVAEDTKKWLGEFLLTVVADRNFREANNVQFITALAACNDQVLDAVKALRTAYTEYQKEKGNLSTQQIIQFDVEKARLETLGKIATLEIYAKLKDYPRSSIYFQPIHVKQTLEVKVGEKLHLITTPKDCQYPDPDMNEARVNRALQIINAIERGDKAAAAAHLAPLMQAAEEGIQTENQRIEATNHLRATRGETPLPLERPLSDNFKNIDTWTSERELLLADQSLEFSLRKRSEFLNSFKKRKALLDEKGREFEDIPDEATKRAAWDQSAEQHGKEIEKWAGDLVMSLVQASKAARIRVHEQLSESPQEIYTVQPLSGLIASSENFPTATEDFYRMELEIAKEMHPSLKTVEIAPACEAADKPNIWLAAQLQVFSAKGYTPQPADHEKLAKALGRRLEDMPPAKISEHFNTTIAKQGDRLGDLFVVKINKAGDAWIKPEGTSFSLVQVSAENIKGIPLKAGQRTPVDFFVGELKWSNTDAQDNLGEVNNFKKRIDAQERERGRLERLASKETAQSAASISNLHRLETDALKPTPIDPEKQYNQLLFLRKSNDNKSHLFAAVNQKGEEVLLIGNPPSTEKLTPGEVLSFNKGTWERKTPTLIQSQELGPEKQYNPLLSFNKGTWEGKTPTLIQSQELGSATKSRSSSPEARKQNLDSNSQLASDRKLLEKDAGLAPGISIEFYEWNGKHPLIAPFSSITPNGAYTQMQIGQSATPRAVFTFISNEQLQQLGLLDQSNQRTKKGEECLQKGKSLPTELQRLPHQGFGLK